ncbi:DUF7146 domain-containing protein (plasmid) [Bradyrhizobium oligotrophicum S58]
MSRLSDAELDDLKARNPLRDWAEQYGVTLRKAGRKLAGPCPMCGGKKRNGRFEIFEDGASWACAVCCDGGDVIKLVQLVEGVDFKAAVDRLGGVRAIDPEVAQRLAAAREAKQKKRDAEAAVYREAERKRLHDWWLASGELRGTPAARYLEGRGLDLPATLPGLRFHPEMPYFHGDVIDDFGRKSARVVHRGPAMLGAFFVDIDQQFGGLHITWIDDGDPPRKIALPDPDEPGELLPAKKMRGSKSGAYILIAPAAGVPRRLIIGEGIETVLAVHTALVRAGREISDTACWAAGDLGNLAGPHAENVPHPALKLPSGRPQRQPGPVPDMTKPGLPIPDEVTELILLGDGDSEPVLTSHAMTRAARRYAKPGRTIRIAMAPAGMDFNDLLQGEEG